MSGSVLMPSIGLSEKGAKIDRENRKVIQNGHKLTMFSGILSYDEQMDILYEGCDWLFNRPDVLVMADVRRWTH